jgi:hypothetical protein
MEFIDQPFIIQSTVENIWLVTWKDAAVHPAKGAPVESVSFTVALPSRTDLSIRELQTFALKRAMELLQQKIRMTTGA